MPKIDRKFSPEDITLLKQYWLSRPSGNILEIDYRDPNRPRVFHRLAREHVPILHDDYFAMFHPDLDQSSRNRIAYFHVLPVGSDDPASVVTVYQMLEASESMDIWNYSPARKFSQSWVGQVGEIIYGDLQL